MVAGTPRLTPAEAQGFVYFRDHTSREAAGCFGSAFWQQLVLQLAHRESAVMHAAVAVGAMHRGTRGRSPSLRLPDLPQSHGTFALAQYVRGIRQLRGRLAPFVEDRQAPEIALVACLLFVCLEMLQGNRVGALMHLRNGLRVLAGIPSQVRQARGSDPPSLLVPRRRPTGVEQLTEIFARLDLDSTAFGERAPAFHMASRQDGHGPDLLLPSSFQDISEARHFLDRLFSTAHHLRGGLLDLSRRSCRHRRPDAVWQCCAEFAGIRKLPPSQSASCVARIEALQASLVHWLATFRHLRLRSQDCRAAILLDIRYHSVFLHLATSHNDREIRCDRFNAIFQRVVDLCGRFTADAACSEPSSPVSAPTFVLDSGLIPALYLTALKCRQSEIRRKAISLLHRYPCQEGMWEPALMAQFVEGVRRREEETARTAMRSGAAAEMRCEDVSEAARFCDVVLAVTEQVGQGRLVCARYLHETTGELEITEHLIPIVLG